MPRVPATPSASEITLPSFRPPIQNAPQGGGLVLPPSPDLQTPPGAEKLSVRIQGLSVEGSFPELESATRAMESRLTDQSSVSGAEIFAVARELEAAYSQAGFVLARVVLPPQEINDGGILRLVVVDGFIEGVETKDVPSTVRDRISSIVAPLVGRRRLRLSEIERRVLLAGDTYGVVLRSTLAPGAESGATTLVLDAKYRPVTGLVTFDNLLPQAFNTYTFGLGASVNSVLGLGEQLYVRAFGNPFSSNNGYFTDAPLNRGLAAGVVLPIGYDGFTVNVEGTKAQTTPLPVIPGLLSKSDFQRLSLRGRYPWIRSRQLDLATEVALDVEDDKQSVSFNGITLPLSEDQLSVFRITVDGQYAAPWQGSLYGRLVTSIGVDTLGARTATDAAASGIPLSRQGADASFTKVEAALTYTQAFFDGFVANLNVQGQTSFGTPLARAERFGIASPTGLSTFDIGTFMGDSGYVVRSEVGKPFVLPEILENWAFMAVPYLFGALGQVFNADPTFVEYGSVTAASYGIGVRLSDAEKGALTGGSLTLEFGAQQRSDGVPPGVRFNIILTQKF